MIPDEDRGPAWLRDYGFTDYSSIEADIEAMEHFASKLAADVVDNYVPHMYTVSETMGVALPENQVDYFNELSVFLQTHTEARDATHINVYGFANGTNHFATAAQTISDEYKGSDARSHAKVKDVDKAFAVAADPELGSTNSGSDD
jgi:hypothetical protein